LAVTAPVSAQHDGPETQGVECDEHVSQCSAGRKPSFVHRYSSASAHAHDKRQQRRRMGRMLTSARDLFDRREGISALLLKGEQLSQIVAMLDWNVDHTPWR